MRKKMIVGLPAQIGQNIEAIVAFWLMKRYGKEKYPGIEEVGKDNVIFFNGDGEQFDRPGCNIVNIGVGGGCFDTPNPVFTIAKYLGIENNPELEEIFRYLKDGRVNPFDFRDLLLCLEKQALEKEELVQHVLIMLNAKLTFDKKKNIPGIRLDMTPKVIREWERQSGTVREDLARKEIMDYLYYLGKKENNFFDFSEIIEGLSILGRKKYAFEIGVLLMDAKYKDEASKVKEYRHCLLRAEKLQTKKGLVIIGEKGTNDKYFGLPAWKKLNATVVIQQTREGGMVVLFNSKYRQDKDSRTITAMLRLEEQMWHGRKDLIIDFNKLARVGESSDVPNWYLGTARNSMRILNDQGRPTAIPVWRIKEIVCQVLESKGDFNWSEWVVGVINKRDKETKLLENIYSRN